MASSIPDSELILQAYAKWGAACVEHLRGDFSFAIWDEHNKHLFCARDQFGIKPFYYASVGSFVISSNTLDCVRRHPAVSGRLNDLAIADFLLFDMIREPAATSFADIHRSPARAYPRLWARRYLTSALLGTAGERPHSSQTADGVRSATPGTTRSGSRRQVENEQCGSPDERWTGFSTVAASAQRVLTRTGSVAGLCAYTGVFERLIPDEERYYAGLVAEALKSRSIFTRMTRRGCGRI